MRRMSLPAAWQGSAAVFRSLADTPWTAVVEPLQAALAALPADDWLVALDVRLLRLQRRVDAVLVTDRAVLAIQLRAGAFTAADRLAAEDGALDLADFHA